MNVKEINDRINLHINSINALQDLLRHLPEDQQPRRRATVKLNDYWKRKLGITDDVTECFVLGLIQYSDEDGAYPIFVSELLDGRVIETEPTAVTFDVKNSD